MNRRKKQFINKDTTPVIGWHRKLQRTDAATLGQCESFLHDVRQPHEFKAARIAGIFLVPMSRLDTTSFSRSAKLKPVLLCRARATAVSENLQEAGCDDLYIFDGGLEVCAAAGFETEN